MPSWGKIIGFGTLIIVLLGSCALGANFILNFQYQPGGTDTALVGVILFFILIPLLGVLWKLTPSIIRLVTSILRH